MMERNSLINLFTLRFPRTHIFLFMQLVAFYKGKTINTVLDRHWEGRYNLQSW